MTRLCVQDVRAGDVVTVDEGYRGAGAPRRVLHVWHHEDRCVVWLIVEGDDEATWPVWMSEDAEVCLHAGGTGEKGADRT